MKIIKKVQGQLIELDLIKVKDYPNGYTLFDVYKADKFMYRTCFTSLQVKELATKGFVLGEEETPVDNSLEKEILKCM